MNLRSEAESVGVHECARECERELGICHSHEELATGFLAARRRVSTWTLERGDNCGLGNVTVQPRFVPAHGLAL